MKNYKNSQKSPFSLQPFFLKGLQSIQNVKNQEKHQNLPISYFSGQVFSAAKAPAN